MPRLPKFKVFPEPLVLEFLEWTTVYLISSLTGNRLFTLRSVMPKPALPSRVLFFMLTL
jgi:hypothetical protein